MRTAACAMSRPSLGMSEPPIPGRSGAMTVKCSASRGISGLHIREVSAYPCSRTTAGPRPAVRYCSLTPPTLAVRTATVRSPDGCATFLAATPCAALGASVERPTMIATLATKVTFVHLAFICALLVQPRRARRSMP